MKHELRRKKDDVPAILPSGDRNNAQAVYSRAAVGICAGSAAGNRRPRRAGSRTLRLFRFLLFQPLLQKPFQHFAPAISKGTRLDSKKPICACFLPISAKNMRNFFCILKVAFLPREKHGKNKGAITMEKIKLGIIGVGNMGTCHIETTAP